MKQRTPSRRVKTIGRNIGTTMLAIALNFSHSVAAYGAGETMADFMAEAMSRMMQAMGSMGNKNSGEGPAWSMPSMGQGFPGMGVMPYSAMMPGMTNWNMPFQGPTQMFGMNDIVGQLGTQTQGNPLQIPNPWFSGGASDSPFEGIWEGASGELVVVQGERFRIYAPGATYVDGIVKIQGDRVALYNPTEKQARPFDYAMQQGRLVLRDDTGQLFLYRRLVLDAQMPAEPTLGER